MRFYIAHVRGPDYAKLRKAGFLVMYPEVDDYVFLEATDKNKAFLRKQMEYQVSFLKAGGQYVTVSEAEIEGMKARSVDQLVTGDKILVVDGYCENLDGEIIEQADGKFKCRLDGWNRTYEVWLIKSQITKADKDHVSRSPSGRLPAHIPAVSRCGPSILIHERADGAEVRSDPGPEVLPEGT